MSPGLEAMHNPLARLVFHNQCAVLVVIDCDLLTVVRFLLQPIADIRRMLVKDQEEAEEKITSIEVCVCLCVCVCMRACVRACTCVS